MIEGGGGVSHQTLSQLTPCSSGSSNYSITIGGSSTKEHLAGVIVPHLIVLAPLPETIWPPLVL